MVSGLSNTHKCIVVFLFMTLLLLFSLPGYAAEFSVKLDKNEVETGKYFLATISYRGNSDPGQVNLSQWQQSFYVDIRNSELSVLENGQIQRDTQVRLYPRLSGKHTLASLALGGEIATSQRIIVTPSIRNNIDSTPVLQPLQQDYWTDQAIIISIDIALHDARNNVKADDFDVEGFMVRKLKTQRFNSVSGDIIRLQWMLLTPNKGIYNIRLPSIQQRGRGRFRYYLPILRLKIKPIPAYLPASIPVGRLSVHSELIKNKNQSALWQLKIENIGRLPVHIEGLQRFLDQAGINRNDIVIENKTDSLSAKATSLYKIQVPEWNFNYPNELKLAYFDTTSGRLQHVNHQFPWLLNIPGYAITLALFIVLAVIFYAGYQLYKLAVKISEWRHFRLRITQSTTANQLRKLLLDRQNSKHLNDWASHQQHSLKIQIAKDLNALCFERVADVEFEPIKSLCLDYFTYRHLQRN